MNGNRIETKYKFGTRMCLLFGSRLSLTQTFLDRINIVSLYIHDKLYLKEVRIKIPRILMTVLQPSYGTVY